MSCVSLQIVLENSSREDKHECPFGRSSIELTKMLCEILKVGELRKSRRYLNPYVELSRVLSIKFALKKKKGSVADRKALWEMQVRKVCSRCIVEIC